MADSAARIAEIRAALNSTGKSIKAYSKRFAAGEAPEQQNEHGAHLADASSVREDEIKELLANLTALSKDLHGRCVGRNADDVDVIHDGLVRLTATWDDVRRVQEQELTEIRANADSKASEKVAAEVQRQVTVATSGGGGVAAVKAAEARAAEAEAAAAAAKAEAEAEAYKAAAEEVKAEEEAAKAAAATERAVAAEASAAALEKKLAELEAQLATAHTFDAAATVEDGTGAVSPTKDADLQLARAGIARFAHALHDAPNPHLTLAQSISGTCVLGSTLRLSGVASLPHATFQWMRLSKAAGGEEPIGGATRAQYAPEPRDMGLLLSCAIVPFPGAPVTTVSTPGPVADMDGLPAAVSAAATKESVEFNCVVVQRNGEMQDRREVHQLEVLADRVKLKLKGKTRYKESYTDGMQVCGARGGGDAAAQGLFLALSPSLVFMLACESAKQRNTAILLIRSRALERGFQVLGPKDR